MNVVLPNFRCFVYIFRNCCLNFDQFLIKYGKTVKNSLTGFTLKDRVGELCEHTFLAKFIGSYHGLSNELLFHL